MSSSALRRPRISLAAAEHRGLPALALRHGRRRSVRIREAIDAVL